jgi:hypothetical protein
MSTPIWDVRMMSVSTLASKLESQDIVIPVHQRNYVWSDKVAQVFIDSIIKGMPCPSLLVYEERFKPLSLEDGSQRLRTIVKFMKDEFGSSPDPDVLTPVKFSELSEPEKARLQETRLAVIVYSNATKQQRIEIFDRFQNGSPLKVGERLHSLSYTMLVDFTIKTLLTPDQGYHDRATAIWGPRLVGDSVKDKRFESLINATAIIAGCAHGPDRISKKYNDLRPILLSPIDEEETKRVLEMLFSIYEDANLQKPLNGKGILNKQWPVGNFTGYIIASLKTLPEEWPRLRAGWVNFLVQYRNDTGVLKCILQNNMSTARSWSSARWKLGYNNVFNGISTCTENDSDEDLESEDDSFE